MADSDKALLPRRMTSAPEAARGREEIEALLRASLATPRSFLEPEAAARAVAALADFEALYEARPVRDNKGGSGFNDSLWLYVLARALAPSLIVECGSFRGHSAWLFRQACPDAEIHSFDVDTGQLVHREPSVRYHQGDWAGAALPPADPAGSLLFLDDHISHARRLVEAHARGFRRLLLDDNFPVHQLYATGGPPVPTLAMILDPALPLEREIAWTRNGKAYSCRVERAEVEAARALVAQALVLPELAPLTRHPPGSALTLVKLVD